MSDPPPPGPDPAPPDHDLALTPPSYRHGLAFLGLSALLVPLTFFVFWTSAGGEAPFVISACGQLLVGALGSVQLARCVRDPRRTKSKGLNVALALLSALIALAALLEIALAIRQHAL